MRSDNAMPQAASSTSVLPLAMMSQPVSLAMPQVRAFATHVPQPGMLFRPSPPEPPPPRA